MKRYSPHESDLSLGDKIALRLSRFMSTWPFIILLSIAVYEVIHICDMLMNGKPLDVFNVFVSLYTLFVDLILLRSAISQRNMDRGLSEKIDSMMALSLTQENMILAQDEKIIKLEKLILSKTNEILYILKRGQ